MVRDALRGYLALASGISDMTAARARATAKALVEQGEATAGQVSALADDLVATSRRNRESLLLLVRHEVEQTVKRLGLAPAADVDALTRRVRDLERNVRELKAAAGGGTAGRTATKKATPKPRATQKAAAKPPAKKSDAATSGATTAGESSG